MKKKNKQEFLYRYEGQLYSRGIGLVEGIVQGTIAKVQLDKYRIVKRTPCGIWIEKEPFIIKISEYFPRKKQTKFVLMKYKDGRIPRKKFAHETPQEALKSFIARKEAHIWHLQREIKIAERFLFVAQDIAHRNKIKCEGDDCPICQMQKMLQQKGDLK